MRLCPTRGLVIVSDGADAVATLASAAPASTQSAASFLNLLLINSP